MSKLFTILWILAIVSLSIPAYSQAKTGYVSDMLILTFRQGPATSFPVLQTLKSNTRLTVLEEDNGYYKVELDSGKTGWVDKQFITFEIPKAQIIEKLNQEKANLKTRLDANTKTLEQLKTQFTTQKFSQGKKTSALITSLKETMDKNNLLSTQLKTSQAAYNTLKTQSKNVLEIVETNKVLEKENAQLSQKLTQLEKKTSHLFKSGMIKWFLAGVGVLLLGWVIGQSVSSKKRRSNSLLG
ncbi:MAG: TIGR04211 family SH3 domain-containing protein [Desulfobacteraceae bacterium]|nr:TIGR04211 family SH3 domain-containing protein [Desulfobacteraceae bacterium]